jgi:hypothetical protein
VVYERERKANGFVFSVEQMKQSREDMEEKIEMKLTVRTRRTRAVNELMKKELIFQVCLGHPGASREVIVLISSCLAAV